MRKRRHFGITVNGQDTFGGMIVNNIRTNHNSEVAEARDQFGKIIDYAVYNLDNQITIDGLYTGENVSPGSIIVVKDVSYIVTSTKQQEANNTFQTGSLIAVHYPQYVPPTPPIPPIPPILSSDPLTFRAIKGPAVITFNSKGNRTGNSSDYKINDGDWELYTWGNTIELNMNDKVSFRSNGGIWWWNIDVNDYFYFNMTGYVEAGGNLMSLDSYHTDTNCDNQFYRMFAGCTGLVTPPCLPASTLNQRVYQDMFEDCTSLTSVPQLPTKDLSDVLYNDGCYTGMFAGCTSLTSVPVDLLPAMNLSMNVYGGMFDRCTSLINIPNLPATGLAYNVYQAMFRGCTSLTSVPVDLLPAMNLSDWCYQWMFEGCTGLITVPNLPATGLAYKCYQAMFRGCTSLTSVPVDLLPAVTLSSSCYESMFEGCSNLVEPPQLPAKNLAGGCYKEMFKDCTSLTAAPILSVMGAKNQCFYGMFNGCNNLQQVNVSWLNWRSDLSATTDWLSGVFETGTFYKPTTLTNYRGVDYIPEGWNIVNKDGPLTFKGLNSTNIICLSAHGNPNSIVMKAKINDGNWNSVTVDQYTYYTARLNQGDTIAFSGANDRFSKDTDNYYNFATTGAVAVSGNVRSLVNYNLIDVSIHFQNCFNNLFSNSSGLVDASQFISEGNLQYGCYQYMFKNCTNLTAAPQLPATSIGNYCYRGMFENCTSLSTAPYLPIDLPYYRYCYSNMFKGCINLSSINVNFVNWLTGFNATTDWLSGVSDIGVFTKPAALSTIYGDNYIPNGWTVVNK